jgi:hypothetical protein
MDHHWFIWSLLFMLSIIVFQVQVML